MRGNNTVRIIGGVWRSRLIEFPSNPALRPTPDRVRETLFNWLGQQLDGLSCLDLFAGSGALGFEAASRGAVRVVMVDNDDDVYNALRANAVKLQAAGIEIVRGDGLRFLRNVRETFDCIFLDPPFDSELSPQLLPLLRPRLAGNGLVYVESPRSLMPPEGWTVIRSSRAGRVHYQLLGRLHENGE